MHMPHRHCTHAVRMNACCKMHACNLHAACMHAYVPHTCGMQPANCPFTWCRYHGHAICTLHECCKHTACATPVQDACMPHTHHLTCHTHTTCMCQSPCTQPAHTPQTCLTHVTNLTYARCTCIAYVLATHMPYVSCTLYT